MPYSNQATTPITQISQDSPDLDHSTSSTTCSLAKRANNIKSILRLTSPQSFKSTAVARMGPLLVTVPPGWTVACDAKAEVSLRTGGFVSLTRDSSPWALDSLTKQDPPRAILCRSQPFAIAVNLIKAMTITALYVQSVDRGVPDEFSMLYCCESNTRFITANGEGWYSTLSTTSYSPLSRVHRNLCRRGVYGRCIHELLDPGKVEPKRLPDQQDRRCDY